MISKNLDKNRKPIRLKNYNYFEPGDYFVTICTQDGECLFGEIVDGIMVLNKIGKIIEEEVLNIPHKYPNTQIDIYSIMPNHIHFILSILCEEDIGGDCRGGVSPPLQENGLMPGGETPPLRRKPALGQMIAYFKYQSTKEINLISENPGNKIFQRNYYETIITNQQSYDEIYTYIESNPQLWDRDRNNPKNIV